MTALTLKQIRALALAALDDMKAQDVKVLDVRGQTSITDLMIFASGTSTRHVKSIADRVVEELKKAGVRPIGVEGQQASEWVLADFGDVVLHVMLPKAREFYRLERLWSGEAAEGGG
jgi:ribosome-associated protein